MLLLLLMIFVIFSWGEKFKVQDCKRGLWLACWLMHGGNALDQTENTESVWESTEFLCLADATALTAAWKQRWSVLPNFKIVCLFMLTCGKGFVWAGLQWHPILWTDQSNCTKSELPNFVRNFYDNCRGPPRLFLLDKYAAFSLTSLSLSHLSQCVSQACCSKSGYEEILIYAFLMRSKDVLDVASGFWGMCMYNEGIWWHQVWCCRWRCMYETLHRSLIL